jgi:serine/threonine protein kinase
MYACAVFAGGSLTAMINEQKTVGQRLSHWTALNYFRQVLHTLIYLQAKGILHEDIKGRTFFFCKLQLNEMSYHELNVRNI